MKVLRALFVAGTRPNFVKVASLLRAASRYRRIQSYLVHTGQHFDHGMSQAFFEDLGLPQPDVNLGVGGLSDCATTAEILKRFERTVHDLAPTIVIVVGDVNSTLACALVAAKLRIPLAHVEAGLRSFDPDMPEELNRRLTDAASDFLFVTEESAIQNLIREGVPRQRIFFVGNVMADTLYQHLHKCKSSHVLERLGLLLPQQHSPHRNNQQVYRDGLQTRQYAVLTLHRPSNVDGRRALESLLGVTSRVARRLPIIFPIHPRTRQSIDSGGLRRLLSKPSFPLRPNATGLFPTSPLGYLDFLSLLTHATVVMTDSGGIQEETTVLGIPCLTLRRNTERPVTISQGTNKLVGTNPRRIESEVNALMEGKARSGKTPPMWDGRASERIMRIILRLSSGGKMARSVFT